MLGNIMLLPFLILSLTLFLFIYLFFVLLWPLPFCFSLYPPTPHPGGNLMLQQHNKLVHFL